MIDELNRDWRVKDNLIIAMNILNKEIVQQHARSKKECKRKELYIFDSIVKKAQNLAERHKISLLEASIIIKQEVKKGNIECLSKNYKI